MSECKSESWTVAGKKNEVTENSWKYKYTRLIY